MVWVYASLAVLIFAVLLARFDLVAIVKQANGHVTRTLAVLKDKSLPDEEKEKHVRSASLGLFGSFFKILIISFFCLGIPALFLYALQIVGLTTVEDVVDASLTLRFLVPVTIIALLFILIQQRK